MNLKDYLALKNLEHKDIAQMLGDYLPNKPEGITTNAISNYVLYKRLPSLEIGWAIQLLTKGKVSIPDMLESFRKYHGK